ncbi:MAG: RNA polymerase sporulation sigma factor SigK [Agathobacter sp.]|nr:RNA polymerase sporulation sigma factor SigK [Agathobacter sp.]
MKEFPKPLTAAEEEKALKLLLNGDNAAKDLLVLHNLRLVAHVVKRYTLGEEGTDDLISIGTIGLIKAVNSFKPDYGSKFSTFAIRCIDNEILMYFRSKKKRKGEISIFEPIGTDKEGNQIHLVDVLENNEPDIIENIEKKDELTIVIENLNQILTEQELEIIKKRYGLWGTKEYTQKEIAQEIGISRSYVSRIEKRALKKMKKVLE